MGGSRLSASCGRSTPAHKPICEASQESGAEDERQDESRTAAPAERVTETLEKAAIRLIAAAGATSGTRPRTVRTGALAVCPRASWAGSGTGSSTRLR